MKFHSITVAVPGITVTPATTTANVVLPVAADGEKPKYVHVSAKIDVCHVRFGDASVVATTNDILITPGDSIIFSVAAFSHVAFIKPSGVAATIALTVVPVEG